MSNEAARWLKEQRRRENVSLRDLAKATNLNHTTVSKAEEGDATIETWIKLAEHYGESVLKVLYWAKKMKRPPSDDDVVRELQNRIAARMIEAFPKDEWESVLKRLALEVEEIHDKQQRNKAQTQGR